ncbi:MAG: hypothetical protein R3E86_13310 [Pseudomonadales bacterium]
MRLLPVVSAALLIAALLGGCQSTPANYRDLAARLAAGEEVDPGRLREAFLAADDLPARMERLTELEEQALAIVEDEPLKLGSIGSAILDTYYGSLTGHYVLARFYRHVEAPDAAEPHEAWVAAIQADMERQGDGSHERPMPAVTAVEARMYAVSKGWSPVGAIYQTSEAQPFSLLLQARPPEGPIRNLHFDLTGLYDSMRQSLETPGDHAEATAHDFNPLTLIGFLARQNDTAAQTAVGAYLARENRIEDAINWLRSASRTGNLLANSILASIYWDEARSTDDEATRTAAMNEVMENYLHAIALGSADAMYTLGVLYLNGHYGEDNVASGVPLLKQAAEQGHADALMYLAHLHYAGEVVPRDLDAARGYYVRASELGSPFARRSYARFLLDREAGQAGDARALKWLEELAQDDDAESMVLLGNLYARGVGTPRSTSRAVRWYKRAVKVAPDDANVVNEVAWTLAVTDAADLRRASYARNIMDRLMNVNDDARQRPEYLDTWAAAHAASGDFERAVVLQEQALSAARRLELEDVLEVLEQHLEDFRARRAVTELVP